MDSEDVSHIAAPPQNGTDDIVEFGHAHADRYRDARDHHRAGMAKCCAENQAFESGLFDHRLGHPSQIHILGFEAQWNGKPG